MSTKLASFTYEGQVFSPFTGAPAETDDGPNEQDASLLFVHYGNANGYGYIAKRLQEEVGGDVASLMPGQVAARLKLPGAIVLAVDAGWNGVNHYGFAPE